MPATPTADFQRHIQPETVDAEMEHARGGGRGTAGYSKRPNGKQEERYSDGSGDPAEGPTCRFGCRFRRNVPRFSVEEDDRIRTAIGRRQRTRRARRRDDVANAERFRERPRRKAG